MKRDEPDGLFSLFEKFLSWENDGPKSGSSTSCRYFEDTFLRNLRRLVKIVVRFFAP